MEEQYNSSAMQSSGTQSMASSGTQVVPFSSIQLPAFSGGAFWYTVSGILQYAIGYILKYALWQLARRKQKESKVNNHNHQENVRQNIFVHRLTYYTWHKIISLQYIFCFARKKKRPPKSSFKQSVSSTQFVTSASTQLVGSTTMVSSTAQATPKAPDVVSLSSSSSYTATVCHVIPPSWPPPLPGFGASVFPGSSSVPGFGQYHIWATLSIILSQLSKVLLESFHRSAVSPPYQLQ